MEPRQYCIPTKTHQHSVSLNPTSSNKLLPPQTLIEDSNYLSQNLMTLHHFWVINISQDLDFAMDLMTNRFVVMSVNSCFCELLCKQFLRFCFQSSSIFQAWKTETLIVDSLLCFRYRFRF